MDLWPVLIPVNSPMSCALLNKKKERRVFLFFVVGPWISRKTQLPSFCEQAVGGCLQI